MLTLKNETPYNYSYCFSYQVALNSVKEHGRLTPYSKVEIRQLALPSHVYIKCGDHNEHNTRHYSDLHRDYNGIHHPTFFIRVQGHNQSILEFVCDHGGHIPTCPNYGKQAADRLQMEERRRQEEEERRRKEVQMARERQIQEQIEKENKALEENLEQSFEKQQMRKNKAIQAQEQFYIQHQEAEDYALGVQMNEATEVKENFLKLLRDYNIEENEEMQSRSLMERLIVSRYKLASDYANKQNLPIKAFENLDEIFGFERLSLTENFHILKAIADVTMSDSPADKELFSDFIGAKTFFLICVANKLYKDSKTAVGDILLNIIKNFTDACKENIALILNNKIWNPDEVLRFYLTVSRNGTSLTVVEKMLQQIQTYQIDIKSTITALEQNDPFLYLNDTIQDEKDKDVKAIMKEMRELGHSENILDFLEEVLEKLMMELPKHELKDLDAEMKKEVIELIKEFDVTKPNVEKMIKILIILAVAVEDTTCVPSVDPTKKASGYFPRATQFASILTLLLLDTPDSKGCLLEIATGEGKSCIVAVFALIQSLRGKTVDIVTSNPILARRDQEEWSKLYVKFDVTSSVIPPPHLDEMDSRDRDKAITSAYTASIVYGTVENFAADILRQEFEKKTTRGQRKFDIAVVDEVDYMTLDSGAQITFLSHETIGMRHLDQLLTAIWARVCTCQRIEEAKTGDIVWATGIQYFHKLTTDALFGQNTSAHFNAIHVLTCALQLGLISDKDLREVKDCSSSELNPNNLENTQLEKLLSKFGPQEQKVLLTVFGKIMKNIIQFKFYVLKDGKASFIGESCEAETSISLLLMEQGKACLLMAEKELIDVSVEEISSIVRYSDTYNPITMTEKRDENVILLPKHLMVYIKNRLPVFVENALRAIVMKKSRQYTIDSRDNISSPEHHCIIPIDFKSTGVLEKNKRWGDGLQQFLELKHQLALSPLSSVTNFMSNFHFFQKYICGSGIYGVSGTLGEEIDFNFLKKHYKTSSYLMPTHRFTKKLELPVIQVKGGRESWLKEICRYVKERIGPTIWTGGQSALVVCEDVKTADELQHKLLELKTVSNPGKITLYTRSDKHNIEMEIFEPGDVILATNLGGRGTDFKVTKEVNQSGGLSVILAHFPTNRRVEKQIFGRTSRKGNPGMVQMILNQQDLAPAYHGQSMEEMRRIRAFYERKQIEGMEKEELVEVDIRQELFSIFCKYLEEFHSMYTEDEREAFQNIQDTCKLVKIFENCKMLDYLPGLNALKETWALWLTMHDDDINNQKDVEALKTNLVQVLAERKAHLSLLKTENFYDFIKVAMDRTYLHINDKKRDFGALKFWREVEQVDSVYKAISLYNQAFIIINLEEKDYKKKAIDLLTEAKKAMEIYVSETSNTNVFGKFTQKTKFEPHNPETNFIIQINTRMNLLNSWKNYIEKSLEKLHDLQSKNKDAITKESSIFSLTEPTNSGKVETDEMSIFYEYGMSFVFEVEEKPKFCIDALICFLLGALQLFAGILTCVLSLGTASQIGLGLIGEGISDMTEGIEGMVKGSFDWAEWAVSKALSIGISLVTAGVSCLMKVAKVAEDVAEIVKDIIENCLSAAKDLITSNISINNEETETSSATTNSVITSIQGLASNAASKNLIFQSARLTGTELNKHGISNALKYESNLFTGKTMNQLLEDIFFNITTKHLETNETLKAFILKIIVINSVPESTLKAENPENSKIKDSIKKRLIEKLVNLANLDFTDIFGEHEIYQMYLQKLKDVAGNVAKLMVTEDMETDAQLKDCIEKHSEEIGDILGNIPVNSLMDEVIVPQVTSLDTTEYKQDRRSRFPDVLKVTTEIHSLITNHISVQLAKQLMNNFLLFLRKIWEVNYIKTPTKKLMETATVWLHKTPKMYFHISHNVAHKRNQEDLEKTSPEEPSQEEISLYMKGLLEGSYDNIELELNILTKSDLIEGRGIRWILYRTDDKDVSTDSYPGKDPSTEFIELQVKESPQSGEFLWKLMAPSSVYHEENQGKRGLYNSISQAIGGKINSDGIQSAVQSEMQKNLDQYLPQLKRNLQRQNWIDMATRYKVTEQTQERSNSIE
ncbi:uncharacterized protein LOC142662002 [Rhinoderma darwinii]|uniref:uncharacterized protein LOC142662002 n=1 Tax=Rhinoderma darwinii TaxID=43563 RepID=UPI003F680561